MHKLVYENLHLEENIKKEINVMILIDDESDNMEASEPS